MSNSELRFQIISQRHLNQTAGLIIWRRNIW